MAIKFRIPTAQESWSKWLASNPCPPDEPGAPTINDWIFAAARACQWREIPIDEGIVWTEAQIPSRRKAGTRDVSRTFKKVYGQPIGSDKSTSRRPNKADHDPFNADSLAAVIDSSIADPVQYLRDRSPMSVDIRPSDYLRAISHPGEHFVAMARKDAFGPHVRLWKHTGSQDAQPRIDTRVDDLANSSQQGVWFLSCPINGIEVDGSIRRETNITVFRHAVLECDCPELGIDPADWLRFLIGRSLPIISIIDSGKRGAHAIINTGTSTKEELLAYIESQLKPWTICGADPACLSAYRLTRLANCWRGETGKRQQLLYLNPDADGTPIKELTEIQTNII